MHFCLRTIRPLLPLRLAATASGHRRCDGVRPCGEAPGPCVSEQHMDEDSQRELAALRSEVKELGRENETLRQHICELQARLRELHEELAHPHPAPLPQPRLRRFMIRWLARFDRLFFGTRP